jgi:hypothetical protein
VSAPTEAEFVRKYFQYRAQAWQPVRAWGLAMRYFSMVTRCREAGLLP